MAAISIKGGNTVKTMDTTRYVQYFVVWMYLLMTLFPLLNFPEIREIKKNM